MQLRKLLLCSAVLLWSCSAYAQMETSAYRTVRKKQPDTLTDYRPKVFGAVKAKFETSLYDGQHRFNVRHSRIGVKGFAAANVTYQIQIDFHNEGKISVLDAFVKFQKPTFNITLGQQQIGFSTDLDRAANGIFSNRSFMNKFITTYYGIEGDATSWTGTTKETVGSIGARDIGLRLRYNPLLLPISFSAGIFNGTGINNPEWNNHVNFVGRIEYGREDGLKLVAAHFNGYSPQNTYTYWTTGVGGAILRTDEISQRMIMWGGEVHYGGRNFRIEGEVASREIKYYGHGSTLIAAHVLGFYKFELPRSNTFNYLAPVGRWDMGDNVEFMSRNGGMERFNAHRATLGLNVGFLGNIIGTEVRVQFEKYFLDGKPGDYSHNPMLQDKFTFEVVATF